MDIKKCFEPNCMNEVEYACQCASPEVYSCKLHALKHIEAPGKTHACEFIFVDSCKGTKEALLGFLEKEQTKQYKLKSKIAASFSNNLLNSENELEELLKNLDSSSYVVSSYFEKISETNRVNRSNQDPILGLLRLQPNEAVEKIKTMIPSNSDNYDSAKLFCRSSEKFEKMIECFFRDKFEAYLKMRLINIENTLEEHKKSVSLANNEIKSVKGSIIELVNENKKSLIEFQIWKEAIDLKIENKTSMLISDIARITANLEHNLAKKAENAINIDTSGEKTSEIVTKTKNLIAETDFKKSSLLSLEVHQKSSPGGDIRDISYIPTMFDPTEEYKTCPYSYKKFASNTTFRHIPNCTTTINEPKPAPKAVQSSLRAPGPGFFIQNRDEPKRTSQNIKSDSSQARANSQDFRSSSIQIMVNEQNIRPPSNQTKQLNVRRAENQNKNFQSQKRLA